jgi:hypothetical protein
LAANIISTNNNPSILNRNGDLDVETQTKTSSTTMTYDEAISEIVRLRAIRDALLEEKGRSDRFVERYQEKVAKAERMSKLRELIPRELFIREDTYERELDKVYNWSGISDDDIRQIHKARLNNIKQHGASSAASSSTSISNKDPFARFRAVPEFHKASMDHQAKQNSSNVSKLYKLQGKIAGNNDGDHNTNNTTS